MLSHLPKFYTTPLFIMMLVFATGCATGNSHYKKESLEFMHGNMRLSGFITLPENRTKPFPVLIFVHADGPTPYDSYGYYPYLWKRLAEKGIASYSWHKAGVKNSEGNWLKQSMDD